jgi:gamma-glutamylcyclotransferase (GGCT)/AIG2-like uncharacterized protein YtfP
MALHFAYGSNMNVEMMRTRCRDARPLGVATLRDWRFLINRDGYATVMPHAGRAVHGVLWQVSSRDLASLNAYEGVETGLYGRHMLPVARDGRPVVALVYIARRRRPGRPRPGYLQTVVEAARHWTLPPPYVAALQRWSGTGLRATRGRDVGDLG